VKASPFLPTAHPVSIGGSRNRALFCASLLAIAAAAHADRTSFVRELAKNRSSVYVVVSGPESRALGDRIIRDVKDHRDWSEPKGKRAMVVTPEEIQAMVSKDRQVLKNTVVVLMAASEKPALSPELASDLRLSSTALTDRISRIFAKRVREPKDGLAFNVVMSAPDAERLERLQREFLATGGDKWDQLQINHEYRSAKVVVHASPGVSAGGWGNVGGAWNYVQSAPLGERSPDQEQDKEFDCAYLVDRSSPDDGMPPVVRELVGSTGAKDNSLVAVKKTLPDGRCMAVLSAPNAMLLATLQRTYDNVNAIPASPMKREVVDLRSIGKTPLLVQRGEMSAELAETVRARVAAEMRAKGLKILERGEGPKDLNRELALEQLSGSTATVKKLRSRGLRYVWHLSILNLSGRTVYRGEFTRESDVPRTWNRTRPERPVRYQREKDGDYGRRIQEWQNDVSRYDSEYQQWEEAVVPYRQQVIKTVEGRAMISLKLFDLEGELGEVVWEKSLDGGYSETSVEQNQVVTVRGGGNIPNSPSVPESDARCPADFLTRAAQNGGRDAVGQLLENAWLTGDPYGHQKPQEEQVIVENEVRATSAPAMKPAARPVAKIPKLQVAARTAAEVTLNLGSEIGIASGDVIRVTASGKTVSLKVVRTGKRAVCRPATAKDRKLLSLIKPGMSAKWEARGGR
jgi:hypothetical protein